MEAVQFVINQVPTESDLVNLYQSLNWGHYQYPELLLKAIQNSDFLVCAYVNQELIGLGRAITDAVFTVYFPDLLVKPHWQGQGIGKTMMKFMLDQFKGFHNQVLIAEDDQARNFYLQQGFQIENYALSITCNFAERLKDAPLSLMQKK